MRPVRRVHRRAAGMHRLAPGAGRAGADRHPAEGPATGGHGGTADAEGAEGAAEEEVTVTTPARRIRPRAGVDDPAALPDHTSSPEKTNARTPDSARGCRSDGSPP